MAMPSNKQLAIIHVAKAKVGLNEGEYRAFLTGFNIKTAKDIRTRALFKKVMRGFEKLGFQRPASLTSKNRLLWKIGEEMKPHGLTDAYVNGVAKRMFGISSYKFCTSKQLWKVLNTLIYYNKRKAFALEEIEKQCTNN